MKVKRRLYEGVAVSTALYGVQTWSVTVAEKRLNVMEMRCGIMHMRCEERTGVTSRAECVEVVKKNL